MAYDTCTFERSTWLVGLSSRPPVLAVLLARARQYARAERRRRTALAAAIAAGDVIEAHLQLLQICKVKGWLSVADTPTD
jgi:hypothetical protein